MNMGGNCNPWGLEKEDRQDDQSEFVDSIIDTNNDDSKILISVRREKCPAVNTTQKHVLSVCFAKNGAKGITNT